MEDVLFGIDRIEKDPNLASSWGACALLANQASYSRSFQPSWKVAFAGLGTRLKALLGPQHGFSGTVQDNMIETRHGIHQETGLPVFSLYSETREPTEEMLSGVDTLIIDLQTVGCRVYTFKYTVAACLRAARRFGKKVVVLDRPNPIGGKIIEGRVLELECRSFVGEYPIPMRHAMTVGEAALLFNKDIGADLDILSVLGWNRGRDWRDLKRPWIPTSPNLPTIESVIFYPGTVIFEGTNVSEGRGTSLPFQLIGAPYIQDATKFVRKISEWLGPKRLEGVFLRPAQFEPTFHKWTGIECGGCQLILTSQVMPDQIFAIGIALLRGFMEEGKGKFEWKSPPYEYNFVDRPMDLILGSKDFEKALFKQDFLGSPFWLEGVSAFREKLENIALYS